MTIPPDLEAQILRYYHVDLVGAAKQRERNFPFRRQSSSSW